MNFEEEIRRLHQRNKEVEMHKAWETSFVRRIFIMTITFLSAFTFLSIAGITSDMRVLLFSSLVPALAFLFSTLTIPSLRKIWEKHQQNKL